MKLCIDCVEKNKDYHPIKYTLGQCDKCKKYLGVAEVEYRPEVISDIKSIFGDLNKPPK